MYMHTHCLFLYMCLKVVHFRLHKILMLKSISSTLVVIIVFVVPKAVCLLTISRFGIVFLMHRLVAPVLLGFCYVSNIIYLLACVPLSSPIENCCWHFVKEVSCTLYSNVISRDKQYLIIGNLLLQEPTWLLFWQCFASCNF